ncbi:MAG: hypothetical protein QM775_35115 [Pirellulales bacterium]
MTLEQKLHEMWSLDPTLPGLLPIERVFTGCAPPDAVPPYAVLERRQGRIVRNTSHSQVAQIDCVWTARAATYEEAALLIRALAECFDRQSFACDEGLVALLRRREEARTLPRPNRPEFTATYEATLIRT